MILVLLSARPVRTEPIQEPSKLTPAMRAGLTAWLDKHGQAPERYVVQLFTNHDVVFLGEQHRVKHDELFVQSLVDPLYKSGVRVLATEFARSEDQPLIDELLAKKDWDEQLAREIIFRNFVWWGYREYVDLYRVAWDFNRRLPRGAPQFRIVGINCSPDWSFVRTVADLDNAAITKKVWHGCLEDHWAEVILSAVRSGEKVLVHCGIHHAFTRYRQPIVIDGRFNRFDDNRRCGNHVFAALGRRAVTVFLHAPWAGDDGYDSPLTYPANGVIDALMLEIGPRPVAFDLSTGPFGGLKITHAVYRHGYDHFSLAKFCDGWIYTKPISEFEGVTPIPDWINPRNLDRARAQSPNPSSRKASVEEFNEAIASEASAPRKWRERLR